MAPTTTAAEKAVICTMKKSGCSHDEIRAALLHHHSLSNRQINRIFKRYAGKENYDEVGHSTGRPPKLTPRARRVALRHLANGDARNATELRNEYFPDVSVDTVKSALRMEGRHAYIRTTVPFISEKNLCVRRKWAELRLDWTPSNWRAVNYSDESIFRIFGSDGIEWCWRKPEERLDPRYTKKKVKYGGGKVTVWGMITARGVGQLVRIEGNLTKELYRDILEDDVLGTYHDLHMDHRSFYFQQDHDPKHTAKIVKAWFQENGVDVLDWPPNSPDLNIIENVWDHLDRKIRARKPLPHSQEDLWVALQEEWYSIDQAFIDKLYDSIPDRVHAVYKAHGGNTRY